MFKNMANVSRTSDVLFEVSAKKAPNGPPLFEAQAKDLCLDLF